MHERNADRDIVDAVELASDSLRVLSRADLSTCSDADLLDALTAGERVVAFVQQRQAALMRELAERRGSHDDAAAEVAVELRLTRRAADVRMSDAYVLGEQPALDDALARGLLDLRRVRVVNEAVLDLRDGEPEAVDARLVDRLVHHAIARGGELTATELGAWLRRRAIGLDPAAAERRRVRKTRQRHLRLDGRADGMALLSAFGPAHLLAAVVNTAHACAEALPADDERSRDQACFDAFVELVRRGAANGDIPGALGRRAQVVVTAESDVVAEVAGVGPVPAGVVGDVVRDCLVSWRQQPAVVERCGPASCVPDRAYRPTTKTAEKARRRYPRCVFPGCRAPARRCDLDHTRPWPHGPTCEHNLAPLCRRHHGLKTRGVWRLRRRGDGALVWTSPAGRRITVAAEGLPEPGAPVERSRVERELLRVLAAVG